MSHNNEPNDKMFMEEEHKVIVVGLDNAGKTTILYQFLMNEVVHTRQMGLIKPN